MVDIVVPDLGEVDAVKLVRWLKAVGERVEAGEAVAEVEAAKAVFVVEAPAAGTLGSIRVAEGEMARPGEIIARLRSG
jgi:2-oxoglutarate dehydrogenase E2 component (dihydrolipoamide succinyltransferase)